MMAQYTAAALVSENKVLAHPAVVDSIPTSANQEDHVSMGTIAARKCAEITRNAMTVVAIELLAAAQGLDLHEGVTPGRGSAAARAVIRNVVPKLETDRVLSTDIETVVSLVESGAISNAVEAVIGPI
jgi:histidine ammonia-lyase